MLMDTDTMLCVVVVDRESDAVDCRKDLECRKAT
jgi:hypothetical protein